MEGYCVKCKSKKEIKDSVEVTMKNGRKELRVNVQLAEPVCLGYLAKRRFVNLSF
jgi:hypothetical protein